jgi:hypothetical protein
MQFRGREAGKSGKVKEHDLTINVYKKKRMFDNMVR